MEKASNCERFPNNIFSPKEIELDNTTVKYYLTRFSSLYELYDYLKSKPIINKKAFPSLDSRTGDPEWAGVEYDQALEDLIKREDDNYYDFLNLVRDVANLKKSYSSEHKKVYSVAGGHVNNRLFAVGEPKCYEVTKRVKNTNFITVHFALSYPGSTEDNHIFNRAVILISLIEALEKRGYNIDINAFEMSRYEDEIVNNVVVLKKRNAKINLHTLYKASYKKEFLRRILFGVLETLDVQNPWSTSYGKSCKEAVVRQILRIEKNDIYFGTPKELGIEGDNLEEDFNTVLKKLKLDDNFDVKELNDEFHNQVKRIVK